MTDEVTSATQGAPEGEAAPTPAENTAPETGTEQTPQVETQPEQTPEPEKKTPWFQRRIDELTRDKWEEKRRADALAATLEAMRKGQQPEAQQPSNQNTPDVETLATQKAQELVRQQAFNEACNKAYDAGKSEFGDFEESITNLRMVGALREDLIDAALAAGDGHKVLYHLGQNPDEAARIAALSPTRMAIELVKVAQTAAKPKPVSSAPAPIKTVDGTSKGDPTALSDDLDYSEWEKRRQAQLDARRR